MIFVWVVCVRYRKLLRGGTRQNLRNAGFWNGVQNGAANAIFGAENNETVTGRLGVLMRHTRCSEASKSDRNELVLARCYVRVINS